jgi:hypothetical protein
MGLITGTGVMVATTGTAVAQALPGPNQFVSALDLECFETPGPALNQELTLSHLNPVLLHLGLPAHKVFVRELEQTCVPVQKNGVSPPNAVLPFIQHVDLACYRIEVQTVQPQVTLTLKHLNPVLASLPVHVATLTGPNQLCLPVAKNNVGPPAAVAQLVRFIDLECWKAFGDHPIFGVNLKQLNPQLGNIPAHDIRLTESPRQVCVPVRKNNQLIPPATLDIVQWIDLEKFAAEPNVGVPPTNILLRHLNPLFTTLPGTPVVLERASALMVPVSKNGVAPPPP